MRYVAPLLEAVSAPNYKGITQTNIEAAYLSEETRDTLDEFIDIIHYHHNSNKNTKEELEF